MHKISIKINKNNNIPIKSLVIKNGSNLILSKFNIELIELEDPKIWRKIIWIKTIIKINNGRIKWKEKNRIKVG